MAGGKLAAVRSCDENKGGRLNGSVCDSMSRISWQSHNPTYPGDTDLWIKVILIPRYSLWLWMCRMMSHLLDNPLQCVFSDLWWLNDSLNSHAYTSCLWARGGDDADGEWRMSRAVIIRALYLYFNQKQWCTIHMSSFPVISGPNDNLGGWEVLVTNPGTNYRPFTLTIHHWSLTSDHTSSDLETRGHGALSTPTWSQETQDWDTGT